MPNVVVGTSIAVFCWTAGGFISGGSEQPLHCLLQGVPCGGTEVLQKGAISSLPPPPPPPPPPPAWPLPAMCPLQILTMQRSQLHKHKPGTSGCIQSKVLSIMLDELDPVTCRGTLSGRMVNLVLGHSCSHQTADLACRPHHCGC